jgi:Metal-sensitive transcriptional repressor
MAYPRILTHSQPGDESLPPLDVTCCIIWSWIAVTRFHEAPGCYASSYIQSRGIGYSDAKISSDSGAIKARPRAPGGGHRDVGGRAPLPGSGTTAVERALGNAKKELIKDHIHHCMQETSEVLPREFKAMINEFQEVTKYL